MSSKVELAMSKVRPEDLKACQDSMRKGSKSFYLASALLPASVRPAITIYYAWCRSMDDAIDEAKDIETAKNNLKAEEKRLDDIFSKDPETFTDPVDRAFSTLVQTADLPKSYAVHLWEGNLWDCEGRRYETLDDLMQYCERVASSVGWMSSALMGAPKDSFEYAGQLGAAMQLTNIARDVGEDARKGKIYLPLSWLREERITEEELTSNPVFMPQIGRVVSRLLREADRHYEESKKGIWMLPKSCQLAILSASHIYRQIKDSIIQNHYDTITTRAYTSLYYKLYLVLWSSCEVYGPPLSWLTRYLPFSSSPPKKIQE